MRIGPKKTLQGFILVISLAAWFATSCGINHSARDLKASVSTIRDYQNSFIGLDMQAARARLSGAKLKQDDWHSGGFGGPRLVATFPDDYEFSALFYEDKVVATSFEVLTK